MTAQGAPREDVEQRLVERATRDAGFRQQLINDPRRAVEGELGVSLPAGVNVRVVEESANDLVLVLPPAGAASGQLSDAQLGAVAGGSNSWNDHTCVNAGC
jgi:hypothetical protein